MLAATVVAQLPELGVLTHKQIAALVGVAPLNRDSGHWRGKRTIWGGRPQVRARCTWARWSRPNPLIRPFYVRLLAGGKPTKLALTACMRKLPDHSQRHRSPRRALAQPGRCGVTGAPILVPAEVLDNQDSCYAFPFTAWPGRDRGLRCSPRTLRPTAPRPAALAGPSLDQQARGGPTSTLIPSANCLTGVDSFRTDLRLSAKAAPKPKRRSARHSTPRSGQVRRLHPNKRSTKAYASPSSEVSNGGIASALRPASGAPLATCCDVATSLRMQLPELPGHSGERSAELTGHRISLSSEGVQ